MHDGAYVEPHEASAFFEDGRGARPQVAGTVARGRLQEDDHLHRGLVGGEQATVFPMEVTPELLERGQSQFGIYCAPCHDAAGTGQGMIVKRGFTAPPTYHSERLREMPVGYFFDVITNGFGAMYDFSDRIAAEDRWAIVAYVRALQLAQNAQAADLPESERQTLEESSR
jgi:mono/diheme cytochrome c family protein